MKVISSWSGGKDAALALYKAIREGHEIGVLLNFTGEDSGHTCFHGMPNGLMSAQAEAMGAPLVQKTVPEDGSGYEDRFKSALRELNGERGLCGMVFGDIYLDEHKEWVDRVCGEAGILPFEPLWNRPTEDLMREFIDAGFKAVVVSAKADLFGEEILGREIDRNFIEEMKAKDICPCGENGEFHTFVYDGPIFKKKVILEETGKVLKNGFWKHWLLDIKKYRLAVK